MLELYQDPVRLRLDSRDNVYNNYFAKQIKKCKSKLTLKMLHNKNYETKKTNNEINKRQYMQWEAIFKHKKESVNDICNHKSNDIQTEQGNISSGWK